MRLKRDYIRAAAVAGLALFALLWSAALAAQPASEPRPEEGYAVREQVVTYASPKGYDLRMTVFMPQHAGPEQRPAVLLIHGGAWVAGWRQQLYWFGRRFAEAGFVAASMEYRKLPQFGFPECVQDAKAAVRWLRSHADSYGIDPDRIIASGHSAGGYIAMMLACTDGVAELEGTENLGVSSAIQGIVSVYGAVDLSAYREPEMSRMLGGVAIPLLTRFLKGITASAVDPLKSASPSAYIGKHMCPVLFIHGDRDILVPWNVAHDLYGELQALGVPSKFVTFHQRGHSFERFSPPARRQLFREIMAFLEAEGLAPAPAPGRAGLPGQDRVAADG